MKTNVSIGPSTVVGWASAAAAIIASVILAVDENRELFTGPSNLLLKIAAGLLIATHAGRQYQAAHLPGGAQVGQVLDELPPALQGATPLAAPPEPDHGDGPNVEFSGAPDVPAPAPPAA